MAKSQKAYIGLGWIISLILAIIPITNIVFGIVTRIIRGHIIAAIFNFFLCFIFYIIDLVCIIVHRDLKVFA